MAIAHRRKRIARPPEVVFVSTVAVVSLFALYSFGKKYTAGEAATQNALASRALAGPDLECRLVHNVHKSADKCAFILQNCPDEEAGLLSYLQLYYCSLANAQPVAFTLLVIWISILFSTIGLAASDFLCINLSTIAAVLGMSESLTGVTFLAFGNGSPDVFSTFAAMKSHSGSLAVGELMGAAGFITAVVTGSMAIIRPFRVGRKSFVRDVAFFAVAASFSLVFLRDGSLRLWECIAMVAFYIFYVVFVVTWHWWQKRQYRKRVAELEARLHHHVPGHEELEVPEIEVDEESRPAGEREPLLRSTSGNSIPTIMAPDTPAWRYGNEDEDEARDRYLAELQSNMRVGRRHERRNTITPIRPSLIGAIEFRSVLSALEKKSTTSSIGLRQYSDDRLGEAQRNMSLSQPHLAVTAPEESRPSVFTGRNRAVSANDAAGLRIDPDALSPSRGTPETAIYSPGGRPISTSSHRRVLSVLEQPGYSGPSFSSNVMSSPSSMSASSTASSPRMTYTEQNGRLAPPTTASASGTLHSPDYLLDDDNLQPSPMLSPNMDVPVLHLPDPKHFHSKSPLNHQVSPGSSPSSTRPPSIRLPPPHMSPESGPTITLLEDDEDLAQEMRRYSWWPYSYLPSPQAILSTLFPQLYQWRHIGILGRIIAIATAPMVFLLTITLPVVEPMADEESEDETAYTSATTPGRSRSQTLTGLPPDTPATHPILPRLSDAGVHPHVPTITRHDTDNSKAPEVRENVEQPVSGQREWNRWLVILQLFTAPLFIVLIVYANLDDSNGLKELVLFILGSLVFSLICLLLLLGTTSAEKEPRYRFILCFLGFFVAIAWISTIANEVVGVLKAFGVILNMSDAILGLTIFAVGNSLGDLVADVTIARLGYSMMALSACFGGPMLNILLGIGLGGMYMTIEHGQRKHHKHPDQPIQYKPYELEVSTTLMISGITLLVTLCGLLIFVPLNGWRMDRKIGIGLIVLWTLSTTGNVICEVLGVGTEGPTT